MDRSELIAQFKVEGGAYCVKEVSTGKTLLDGFKSRQEAKKLRGAMGGHPKFIVTKGVNHPRR